MAAVIGHPVRHSLSPVLHNAAFAALGLDWAYLAFDVAPGDGAAAVEAARILGVEGLNVTMPHKEVVAGAVGHLSPRAERLGAVNTVYRRGAEWAGESTDGPGFIDALRLDEGWDPAGRRCTVVGAGGAARAVILALAEAGAGEVLVVNRSEERAEQAARLGGSMARVGHESDISEAELVVNATPVGMAGVAADRTPFRPDLVGAGQVVVDLVYHPLNTPLVRAARERGAVAVTGLGMLIHQAAHAFRLITGEDAPLGAMSAAALGALGHEEVNQR